MAELTVPKSNRKVFQYGENASSVSRNNVLVILSESDRTDATAGKKASKVNYVKMIPIINL